MSGAAALLEGAVGVIESWLADSDSVPSLRPLQSAIEVGGRALLSCGAEDQDEAERYRRSLLRLQLEMPQVEERWKSHQRTILCERQSLDRAQRWACEFREIV